MRPEIFFKQAYDRLWRLIAEDQIPQPSHFLPYTFTTQTGDWIYDLQEQEFTRELLNSINQFSARLHRLVMWEQVISEYEEDDGLELRFEFTRLILYYCLHQPYEFRARLIFSSTQLCYIAGLTLAVLTPSAIADDHEINYKALKTVATRWGSGDYLLETICGLNAKEFRNQTKNYRNRTQHRVAPHVDFGYTNNIERMFGASGGVSYTFGQAPPLITADIVPLLVGESSKMIAAFHVYRMLVDEHAEKMRELMM